MRKMQCGCCSGKKPTSEDSISSDSDLTVKEPWPLWKKILVWTSVVLLIIIVIIILIIWVIIPIVFMLSIAFQRFMIFLPINVPKDPDFHNPETYDIIGVRNFYISVSDLYDTNTITEIGTWLILPESEKNSTITDVRKLIRETKHDILVYLHGVAENRAKPIFKYEVMRQHFLVIAMDHRGYGDSGLDVEMSENAIINDNLQIYDWIKESKFSNNIYYWGHSLGAALSCHTLKALREERNVVPKGLILESAFTTLAEEIKNVIIGKIFKWLPYFEATILRPLDNNGFHFYSTTNILQVFCPIMLLHAEDDGVVPFFLGAKLADVAQNSRNITAQGSVTFYPFESSFGYGHNDILTDEQVPMYIRDFKEECEAFSSN